MDPLMRIIKYLFNKKNIDNKDESINSFFDNGQSFPQFISLIFDVDTIQGVKKNPSSLFQKKINNTSALQFLFQRNQKIKAINPSCENEREQKDLLRLILTMQCYTSNMTTIISKSNSIVEKFGVHISRKDDLLSLKFLSLLINILTDGEFPLSENFLDITQNFAKKNVPIPIFINEDSLNDQNSFIFLIQIQVIFEIYSGKIDQMVNKETAQNQSTSNSPRNNSAAKINEEKKDNENDNKKIPTTYQENHNINIKNDIEEKENSNLKETKQKTSFQDKLKLFNGNEQDQNEKEKMSSSSNISNSQIKAKDQIISNKLQKLTSSFQDKPSDNSSVDFENQDKNNIIKLRHSSVKLQDTLNIYDNFSINQHEEKKSQTLAFDLRPQTNNKESIHQDKIKRLSSLLRDELKLFENTEPTTEISDQSNIEDSIQDNTQNERSSELTNKSDSIDYEEHPNIPPPSNNDINIENLAPRKRLPQSLRNKKKPNNNSENSKQSDNKINFDIIQKLINESKKEGKKEEIDFKQIIKSSNRLIEIWNPPNPNIGCDNGIIFDKSKTTDGQTPKVETSDTSNINLSKSGSRNSIRIYNNFCQIFKYDEESYKWYFCDLNFEQFFNRSNQNMVTPMILFIDSDENNIIQISKYLKKNEFNFDKEESISVFAFQKNPTNVMFNELKNEDIQEEEPFFMFVHVPKEKQNSPQIGTILYQIYTFLFMICDLNIIIFEKKHRTEQIMFIKKIISICKLYSESNEKIFRNKSNILFLYLTEKDKTEKMQNKIKQHILDFQFKCLKQYSDFTHIFDTISLDQCHRFSELKHSINIADSFFSQINGLYLKLKNERNYYSDLYERVVNMFACVKGNDVDSKLSELKKEIVAFFPQDDDQFSSMVDMALVSFQLEYNQEIQNKLINELKKQSSLNIINISKKINEKKRLTKVQMSVIERSHIHYLQQQFFNIIKEISDNYFVDIYFEKKIDVLNERIKEDRIEIQKLFNRFRVDWNKKETVIEKKYEEAAMKGTNYVMREVQKTREIEVIVADDGDIDTEIEPDF